MAMDLKAALRKVSEAKVNGNSAFIRGGTYLMEVKKVEFEEKRSGLCFIAELIVRAAEATATYPDEKAYADKAGKDVIPNKVGEQVATVIKFDGKGADMAGVNVKKFVCGLFGEDPDTVEEDTIFETILGGEVEDENGKKVRVAGLRDPEQPGRGMLIKCVAIPTVTRAGQQFTVLNWETVPEEAGNSAEEIAKRREAQEGKKAA